MTGITLDVYIKRQFDKILPKNFMSSNKITNLMLDIVKSESTVFTEAAAIELILKVINLTSILHDEHLIHTNLCP